jgi:uncharacterized protein (TIGR01244 family)
MLLDMKGPLFASKQKQDGAIMRHAFVLLIILAGSLLVLAGNGLTPDPENLPNLQQPRFDVYTSAQPTETGFREAAALGVRTVINVLPEKDCSAGEPANVTNYKMKYVGLPFDLTNFRLQTIQKFSVLLKTERKPILIHCSTGNHAGGLWFAYRALIEKAPVSVALDEGRLIGMKPELEAKLLSWVMTERSKIKA